MTDLSTLLNPKTSEDILKTTKKNRILIAILGLWLIKSEKDETVIAGSGEDGSVAFWKYDTQDLFSRFIIFSWPMTHIVQLSHEAVGEEFRNNIFCISKDGTIGVISPKFEQ